MGDLMFRWLKLSLVALVACGFIGMVIYALWMRDEIRSAQVEPPLITSPETAAKRRPDEPGGMAIPDRDKIIFDLLDEASTGVSAPAPAPVAGAVAELPLAGAATPTVVVSPVAAAPVAVAAAVPAPQAPLPETKLEPQRVAPLAKPVEAPKAETSTPASKGGYGVQVAAVGSQAAAQRMAESLQAKYAPLKGLFIATPDAGNGHWRVQFTGLASRAAASKVCDQLKGKQSCFAITVK